MIVGKRPEGIIEELIRHQNEAIDRKKGWENELKSLTRKNADKAKIQNILDKISEEEFVIHDCQVKLERLK